MGGCPGGRDWAFSKQQNAADGSRKHWRQVYGSNALLKAVAPSRLRITEAIISLPMELREPMAQEATHYLQTTKRRTFANQKLANDGAGSNRFLGSFSAGSVGYPGRLASASGAHAHPWGPL